MQITFPSDTVTTIDNIRDVIGRDISIYYNVSGIPCTYSGDFLDPVTGLSTNQFCPVCGGSYWLNSVSGLVTKAHITYPGIDTPVKTAGGVIFDGDALIQVKYTDSIKYAVDHSKYFLVDDVEYILKSKSPRGIPTNRLVIKLVER